MGAAPVHLFVAALIAVTAVVTKGNVAAVVLFGGPVASLLYYTYAIRNQLEAERQKHLEQVERDAAEIGRLNTRLQRAIAETNHRVKNNLQVVVSLIEMQLKESGTISAEDMSRLILHIRALSTMHD